MNANELAEELENKPLAYGDDIQEWLSEAATMLRQQQAEIEALNKFLDETCQTGKFIVWNSIKDKAQEK